MLKAKEIIGSQLIGITGSHGFIGSAMFNKLTSSGLNVIRLDREGNVPKDVTIVYDFASYGNLYDQTDEKEIYKVNLDRVQVLLENCKDKKLVLTSSSSVLLPTETHYSKSKAQMESFVKGWVELTKQSVVVVRPSTVTGVGDNENHLIPKLIDSCYTQKPLDFVPEPTHDFIDIDDFLNATILLSTKINRFKGHVFNVSFGVSLPNQMVKDIVVHFTHKEPNLNVVNSLRTYDTTSWKVPNDKLRAIGWLPKKTLFESVEEMVYDYKRRNNPNI